MTNSSFEDVRILDNFYQTSSFFPMPTVLVSTISPSGQVNLGPYSLCFPHIIAGEHSMILISRGNSNTSENIRRTKVCAINFIPYDKKFLKNCVSLGFPGETTEEKMKNSIFTLVPSQRSEEEKKAGVQYPDIVKEAFQVFECTWNDNHKWKFGEDEASECHYVLRINKILLKTEWKEALLEGKGFPEMPIDFGFRDNVNFWFTNHSKPKSEPIPKDKGVNLDSVIYATQRFDPSVKWTEEACAKIVKVPRIFLKKVIKGCVEAAKEQNITLITPEFMDKIRDKRSEEKES